MFWLWLRAQVSADAAQELVRRRHLRRVYADFVAARRG